MVAWPETLPQIPLVDGFSEELPRVTVATEMDAGPAKVRRRFSAGVTKYSFSFVMTLAQRNTFVEFFNTTTLGGSVQFDFPDPYTSEISAFRFDVAQGGPQITPKSGYFKVTFPAEKLP